MSNPNHVPHTPHVFTTCGSTFCLQFPTGLVACVSDSYNIWWVIVQLDCGEMGGVILWFCGPHPRPQERTWEDLGGGVEGADGGQREERCVVFLSLL